MHKHWAWTKKVGTKIENRNKETEKLHLGKTGTASIEPLFLLLACFVRLLLSRRVWLLCVCCVVALRLLFKNPPEGTYLIGATNAWKRKKYVYWPFLHILSNKSL